MGPALGLLDWPLSDVIDEVLFLYTEWLDEATGVEEIYRRWSAAPSVEREHWHGAYIAALDQEEAAALMYAITAAEFRGLLQSIG